MDRVFPLENHDEALYIWDEQGVRGRRLVHVDAHSDYFPARIPDVSSYVYQAHRKGILSEFWWVVPEPTCRWPGLFRSLVRDLRGCGLLIDYEGPGPTVSGRLGDLKVWIGVSSALGASAEAVLLDIDVDYFTTPLALSHPVAVPRPWREPEELVQVLSQGLHWDMATISVSVAGGFTPPQWRCLGAHSAEILRAPETGVSTEVLRLPLSILTTGAEYCWKGETRKAISHFEQALEGTWLPFWQAAFHYWLTRLHVHLGSPALARDHLHAAASLDDGYRSFWVCPAFADALHGNLARAAVQFSAWRDVLPDKAMLLAGWGTAVRRRSPDLAVRLCEGALELDAELLDARICLGRAYMESGQWAQSLPHFEKALALVKTGASSFTDMVRTQREECSGSPVRLLALLKNLGLVHLAIGERSKAKRYLGPLRQRQALAPSHELRLLLAEVLSSCQRSGVQATLTYLPRILSCLAAVIVRRVRAEISSLSRVFAMAEAKRRLGRLYGSAWFRQRHRVSIPSEIVHPFRSKSSHDIL